MDNISIITRGSDLFKEQIEFRVKNALEAIRVAKKYPDRVGVYIG